MAYAHKTLSHWQALNGDHPYYREWARVLQQGPSAVVALIRDPSDHATLLRSVSPLAAYLKAERDAIFSRRPALRAPRSSMPYGRRPMSRANATFFVIDRNRSTASTRTRWSTSLR